MQTHPFEEHRSLLFAMAYHMLGSATEAEAFRDFRALLKRGVRSYRLRCVGARNLTPDEDHIRLMQPREMAAGRRQSKPATEDSHTTTGAANE